MNFPSIDGLWDYNDPKKTERAFSNLLKHHSQMEHNYLLELKTQLARTYSLQRKFEEAHSQLDEIKVKLTNQSIIPKIRYFLERGRTFNSNKNLTKAIPLFEQAFHLSVKTEEDYYAVDAAHMQQFLM